MAEDWKQVNVRVREPTKEEWEEYAETEYGGMTDLIRIAVTREIANDFDGGGTGGHGESAVTDVSAAIDRLENTIQDMDKRLSAVHESIETEEKYSFEAAVRETVRGESQISVREIAGRLNAKESDVREILESNEGRYFMTPDNEHWDLIGGE